MPITGLSSENSAKRMSRVIATITTARISGPTVDAMLKCAGGGSPGSAGTSRGPGGAATGEPRRPVERDRPRRADVPPQVEPERPVVGSRSRAPSNATAPSWTTVPASSSALSLAASSTPSAYVPLAEPRSSDRAPAEIVEVEPAMGARDRLVVEHDRVRGVAPDRPAAGADGERAAGVQPRQDHQLEPEGGGGSPSGSEREDGALVQSGVRHTGRRRHRATVDRDRFRDGLDERGAQHVVQRRLGVRSATSMSRSPSGCRRTTCTCLGFVLDMDGGQATDPLAPGTVLDGRYRIEEEIARGGMGIIYRATHVTLDLPRAVKLITPQFARDRRYLERFRIEATAAARVDHPNVVAVHDFGEVDGISIPRHAVCRGRRPGTAGRARRAAWRRGARSPCWLRSRMAWTRLMRWESCTETSSRATS